MKHFLLNDQEFPRNLLVSDRPRRHYSSVPQSEYTAFSGIFGVSMFSYALNLP